MAKRRPKAPAPVPIPPPPPPPLLPKATGRFKRDVKRIESRGEDMEKFKAVIVALCSRETLPESYRDHALKGEWTGCRDCHVAHDWVIIYERDDTTLTLHRTGTHADLFE